MEVRNFTFHVRATAPDEPTTVFVSVRSEERARALAERMLGLTPTVMAILATEGGLPIFTVERPVQPPPTPADGGGQ